MPISLSGCLKSIRFGLQLKPERPVGIHLRSRHQQLLQHPRLAPAVQELAQTQRRREARAGRVVICVCVLGLERDACAAVSLLILSMRCQ